MGRLSLLLLVAAACGGQATSPAVTPAGSPPAAAVAPPAPPAVGFRLPAGSRPTAYRVTLGLDPAGDTIVGEGEIDIVRDSDGPLYLNASEIAVSRAAWNDTPLVAHVVDADMIAFAGVPAGKGTLKLAWTAKLRRDDTKGVFAQPTDGAWYVYTQFEAMGARRAMPCFDEPGFKVPWQIRLRVPKDLVALSNTPVKDEAVDGAHKLVSFDTTPPLPAYLVAFAVGPFDLLDAGASKGGAAIRIAVPRGRGEEARFPVEDTKPILDLLEDYFGQRYPYAKLDVVPIPDTVGYGAMEHPGLITYSSTLILTKPGERSVADRRAHAGTCAHELAHQWFGNLVTLAWWDDTWLNEAFASWMGSKIIHAWQPSWDSELSRIAGRGRVVELDSRAATRRIREPVVDANGVEDSFDGITYSKGALVLGMVEAWLGEDVFQKGIRHYVEQHAHGNASYADLAAALTWAAGKDVRPVLDSFVDQAGAPFVELSLECEKGKPARIGLAQRRYLPLGSRLDAERTWQIPLRVWWKAGKAEGTASTLLTGAQGELVLEGARTCPELVVPNPDGAGYLVWSGRGKAFERLQEARTLRALPAARRMEVVESTRAQVAAGALPYRRWVALATPLLADPERILQQVAVNLAANFDDHLPEDKLPAYRAWVRQTYGKAARAYGFVPRANESDDDRLLRKELLSRLAIDGEDPELVAEATRLTWAWFDDPAAIAPDVLTTTLTIAAHHGDAKLYDRFLAEAREAHAARDKRQRKRLLTALASFRGAELEGRTLALTLSDEFPLFETAGLLLAVGKLDPAGRARTFAFVSEHYDALIVRLPAKLRARLIGVAASCSEDGLERAKAFFAGRLPKEQSGPRAYAKFVEDEELCIARKPGEVASFTGLLAK